MKLSHDPQVTERLRRAQELIDTQFHQPLDLAALAAEAGFSRFHIKLIENKEQSNTEQRISR